MRGERLHNFKNTGISKLFSMLVVQSNWNRTPTEFVTSIIDWVTISMYLPFKNKETA